MNGDNGGKERDKSGAQSPRTLAKSGFSPRRKGSESPRSHDGDGRSRSPSEERRAKHSESKGDASPSSPSRPPFLRRTSSGRQASKHGKDAFQESVSASGEFDAGKFAGKYRMDQQQHDFGGSGKDESVATSYVRDRLVQLLSANVPGLKLPDIVETLSEARTNTDALVWHSGGKIGGHPGALKKSGVKVRSIAAGHTTKDNARKEAVDAEFRELVPDDSRATAADVEKAATRMSIRGQVETLRTMSQPLDVFEAHKSGEMKRMVIHTQFGDIRNATNYRKMGVYVHNERERKKWIAARYLMESDLAGHVPEVMQEYIKSKGMDHVAAMDAFNTAVAAGDTTRLNTAATSQALAIDSKETLGGSLTRGRALSAPRRRYSK